jgi:hypothetical protein
MKSILQIVALVVLVAVGAVVYLSQDGGLGFIDNLFGDKPAKESPKVAAPAPKPVEAKPKPEIPPIPAQPAKGQIQKAEFTVESAAIENGVLTLRQGKEPLETEVKIYLQTQPWQVPADRSFQILSQATVPDAPLIRIRWNDVGQKAPRQREFKDKYTLRLELGQEKDRKLPGKIYLSYPDEGQIAGSFTADVRGFRLVNGKPDLASDSVDTLQYLALREMLKDDPDRAIKDPVFRQGRFAGSHAGSPPTGYLELEYRTGDGAAAAQKFQFVKENDAWRVVGALRPDQLDEAHPYKVPGPKASPEQLFPYLAAKRVEADVQKRNAGRLVSAVEFNTRYNEKQKVGVSEVNYKVGDGQPVQTAYLYRLAPKGWTLDRELNKKERVNLATGKIELQR